MTCHPPSTKTDRLGEQHVGVRFGDAGRGWSVLLDGEDVTDRCTEAMGGDPGWCLLWAGVRCCFARPTGGHVRTELRRGRVQLIRRPQR
jgi:hypothetical protein